MRAPAGTSGRNTREQVANTLNRTGIYSVVRHPLYLGNYLIILGFALWPHVWWLIVLTSCFYALYYERIMLAEENFLRQRFGETFEKWSAQTPAFLPKFRGWKPSAVPFCWRTVWVVMLLPGRAPESNRLPLVFPARSLSTGGEWPFPDILSSRASVGKINRRGTHRDASRVKMRRALPPRVTPLRTAEALHPVGVTEPATSGQHGLSLAAGVDPLLPANLVSPSVARPW